MNNIAFVTSTEYKELTASDQIAAGALHLQGIRVVPAIWEDNSIDWTTFDAVIVRSPWDYHLHPARFIDWINRLTTLRVPLWNPPDVLLWNMNKTYLLGLEKKEIPIPRTYFLKNNEPFHPADMRSFLRTDEVVIKPIISASGLNTWRCSLNKFDEVESKELNDLQIQSQIMVQEFLPEILADGEWSFIFFGDKFSHAVKKYPGKGEFRVQEELGGRCHSEPNPPNDLVRQAGDVIAAVEQPLLYARVDGIVRSGTFVLIELELVEPALFFDVDPPAAERFARRIKELL